MNTARIFAYFLLYPRTYSSNLIRKNISWKFILITILLAAFASAAMGDFRWGLYEPSLTVQNSPQNYETLPLSAQLSYDIVAWFVRFIIFAKLMFFFNHSLFKGGGTLKNTFLLAAFSQSVYAVFQIIVFITLIITPSSDYLAWTLPAGAGFFMWSFLLYQNSLQSTWNISKIKVILIIIGAYSLADILVAILIS